MKRLTTKFMLAMLIALSTFLSCQKDQLETASGPVFSSKYTTLTLDDLSELPNPATTEQFASKLFDLKEDGDGLTEKELRSLGDPAQNEDLLYALLFVEKFNRSEILWSWDEPKDEDPDDRSPHAQWKWTGGNPIASMYASGFKKWPAWKVKNVFQDPCGDIIQAGPVYQACHKLCDGNMPPPCMSDELKKEILEKIIADTPIDPYSVAKQLVQQSNWPLLANVNLPVSPVTLMNYERQVISGDIVHYKFEIAVGSGQYDKIGIHRVVKETAPGVPVVTDKAVFMLHGDWTNFVSFCLPGIYSISKPDDFGIAVYFAQKNIDVWGIDQAWTLLPEDITDFSFMANWGLQRQYTDLRTAMAIARVTHFLTNDKLEKLNFAGYSSGVTTGFALLNHETQIDPVIRHAKGFIPVDLAIKVEDDANNQYWKDFHDGLVATINSGTYQETVPLKPLGHLGRTDPDGDSPIVPGFTNLQAALFLGCTSGLLGPNTFHYLGGVWENGMPVELRFTDIEVWFDFCESGVYYEPWLFEADYAAMISSAYNTPFEDHFADIKVPIFNVTPGGGFGEMTKYGISQIGSTDVTHYIPSFLPPQEKEYDFAHIDIFLANNAETVMWKPMLDWIKAH